MAASDPSFQARTAHSVRLVAGGSHPEGDRGGGLQASSRFPLPRPPPWSSRVRRTRRRSPMHLGTAGLQPVLHRPGTVRAGTRDGKMGNRLGYVFFAGWSPAGNAKVKTRPQNPGAECTPPSGDAHGGAAAGPSARRGSQGSHAGVRWAPQAATMWQSTTAHPGWRRARNAASALGPATAVLLIGFLLVTRGAALADAISACRPGDRRGDDGPLAHAGSADGGLAHRAACRRLRGDRSSRAAHRERRCLPRRNRPGASGYADADRAPAALWRRSLTRRLADRARGCPDRHVRGLCLGGARSRGVDRGRRDTGLGALGDARWRAHRPYDPPGRPRSLPQSQLRRGAERPRSPRPACPARHLGGSIHRDGDRAHLDRAERFRPALESRPRLPRPVLDGCGGPAADRNRHRPDGDGRRAGDQQRRRRHARRAWWSARQRCWLS